MYKPSNGMILRFAEDKTRLYILHEIAECCKQEACFDCPACYPDEKDIPFCALEQGNFLELPVHADCLKKGDEKK